MSSLFIAAICLAAVGAICFVVSWHTSNTRRNRGQLYWDQRAYDESTLLLVVLVLFAVALVLVLIGASDNAGRRAKADADKLLASAVQAERQFRATHPTFGNDVDLTFADSKLMKGLDHNHRLSFELSADGKTVKITARAGRHATVSRFIGADVAG